MSEASAYSAYSTIRIERAGDRIAWVYLNRPEKRNAMSPQLHMEMYHALDELEIDDEIDVVVIAGAEGNFSSGQDLKQFFRELEDKPDQRYLMEQRYCKWRWDRLSTFPKITIAMVDGWCVGGAFTHLVACDFAIAAEQARFSLSEVNWGIIPGGMVTKAVVEAMGYRDSLYYILTAEELDGARAAQVGLVNRAVPAAELRAEVERLATMLMRKNQHVLRASKQACRMVMRGMDNDQSLDYLGAKFTQLKALDPSNGYSTGLSSFVDGKTYKPVHDPYPRG